MNNFFTYEEIMNDLRSDREEINTYIETFAEFIVNGGDSSSASKEALVNLLKIKTDISDKKAKIADLCTRLKLQDRNTFPRYLAAQQNNTYKINVDSKKKKLELLKSLEEE